MRFLRRLILPTVLIALLLLSLFTAMDYFAALETAEPPAVSGPAGADPESRLRIVEEQQQTLEARPVNPDLFSQPFTEDAAELTRVPPRAPLTPEPEPEEAASTLLHQPVAIGAGILSLAGEPLHLEGIEPTPADRMCENADGTDWPCGAIARTAFRGYLRGRTLDCQRPDDPSAGAVAATCRLGGDDIAAWLAENGWAIAEAGSPYTAMTETARSEGRGLFGSDPRRP